MNLMNSTMTGGFIAPSPINQTNQMNPMNATGPIFSSSPTLIQPVASNQLSSFAMSSIQNLTRGSTVFPSLAAVNQFVTQLFGAGPYSPYPTQLLDLAGTWMVQGTSFSPSVGQQIIAISPLYQNAPAVGSILSATRSTVISSATNQPIITDLVVTDQSQPIIHGYLSLQPGNYITYSPFPSTSVTNAAYLPVAGIGLANNANTISMVVFPNNTMQTWTRQAGLNQNNVALGQSVVSILATGVPTPQYASMSPAYLANQWGVTPQNVTNQMSLATNTAGSSALPMSAVLSPNPYNSQIPQGAGVNPLSITTPNTFMMRKAKGHSKEVKNNNNNNNSGSSSSNTGNDNNNTNQNQISGQPQNQPIQPAAANQPNRRVPKIHRIHKRCVCPVCFHAKAFCSTK